MDLVTQQNAAMVEQSTAAARVLAEESSKLRTVVDRFRTGRDHAFAVDAAFRQEAPASHSPAVRGNLALKLA